MKTLSTLALTLILTAGAPAGTVHFSNSSSTLISVDGAPMPPGTNMQFIFALFLLPPDTVDSTGGIWNRHDPLPPPVAYNTNHPSAAGRLVFRNYLDVGGNPGDVVDFLVLGWSTNYGTTWEEFRRILDNTYSGPYRGQAYYGKSLTGNNLPLGGGPNTSFSTYAPFGNWSFQVPGFNLTGWFLQEPCPCEHPPYFQIQPTSTSVGLGGVVTFSAYTGRWPPTSFQWRKEGAPITGTNSFAQNTDNLGELTITNVTLADAGNYDVVAYNLYGSATSAVARLTVLIPATIGSPTYTTNNQFQFTVTGGAGSNYVVQVATNLAPPTTWISLYTNTAPFTFIDSSANTYSQRFYRANAR